MNIIDRALYRYPAYRKWRGLPEPMSPAMAAIVGEVLASAHPKCEFLEIDKSFTEFLGKKLPAEGTTFRIRKPVRYVTKVSNG